MARQLYQSPEGMLPQNIEAEQAVLGSLLIDPRAVERVASFLHPQDFYLPVNGEIYRGMLALYERDRPADLVTLADHLQAHDRLDDMGGAAYLASLANMVPTSLNVEYYARIVERLAVLRRLVDAGTRIAAIGHDERLEADVALEDAERILFEISRQRVTRDFEPLANILAEVYEKIDHIHSHDSEITGITTGFIDLDRLTSGMQRSDLIILAARPSQGKTALALNIAHAVASRSKLPVGIFSIEMSGEQLAQRLIAVEAQIDSQKLRSGRMSEADWDRLVQAVGVLSEAPIFVDDTPGLTTMEMRSKARRLHSEQGLGLLVVDYLQLMQGSTSDSRVQEISAISRSLKAIARELDVPVLALSQLSRAPEQRPNHEPMLSDLRESGCLTADTRVVRADTGAEVSLGDLLASRERNVPVWSLDEEWRLVPATLTHVFPSGVKPVYRLRLASGREVTASSNHPFRTLHGWTALRNLRPGSRIAVPRVLAAPEHVTAWPVQEVVMLAHLVGDGCVVKGQPIHYTSGDEANLAAVEEAAQHFGIEPRRVQQDNLWHVYLPSPPRAGRGKRNPIAFWLDRLGLYGCHSREKFLPAEVFSLPQEQLRLFLRHLWSTGGCIHIRTAKNAREVVSIYYTTTSDRLAHDLQLLLLRLGIQTRLHEVSQGEHRPSFHVVISGAENQLRFLRGVGVHGARRGDCERAAATLARQVENSNFDTIPGEVRALIIEATARKGMSQRALATLGEPYAGSHLRGSASLPHTPSCQRIGAIARGVHDARLHPLAGSDVAWDVVVAIEPVGEQPVFDATVLGTHNFLANNIVAHNSIEQDADIVMFIYRDVKYNPETERPHVADIIVAKHRNGPTGTIHLFFQDSLMRFLDLSVRDDA